MNTSSLTRHPEGSIRELLSIGFPLMISSFAWLLMIFTDRLFLARYSIDALNASAIAGTLAWAVMGGIGMITAMSEVFVAQYNGAKQYEKIGVPVWQMIWASLLSYVVFAPLAFFSSEIFAGNPNGALEAEFFFWLMLFGPSYALMTAFSGFFIGRGKTKILIAIALIANGINIILDRILIFGIDPYVPEMGVTGAAIATCLGNVFQTAVLAVLFWKKEYRVQFGTGRWKICASEMFKCCKVGLPQGIFYGLEVFGWAIFYWMMTSMSKTHITISSVCQSILILISFFFDGLSRAIAAIAGNCIGSRRYDRINRILRSGFILQIGFCIAVSGIFLIDLKTLLNLLFFEHFDPSALGSASIHESIRICLGFAIAYFFFEGIRWVFSGILVAAGDTLFLLAAGGISVWVGLLAPLYFFIVQANRPVEDAWFLALIYSAVVAAIYGLRFRQGAWKTINLLPQAAGQLNERETGIESVSSEDPKN